MPLQKVASSFIGFILTFSVNFQQANGSLNLVESFVGCFFDQEPRDLPNAGRNSSYTHETCADRCRSEGSSYMGREDEANCWCGNDYGTYGTSENCIDCLQTPGNHNFGQGSNCVFSLDATLLPSNFPSFAPTRINSDFPSSAPSYIPSMIPSTYPSSEVLLDEWMVKFESAQSDDSLQGLLLNYVISKGKTKDQIRCTILDESCSIVDTSNAVSIATKNIFPSSRVDNATIALSFNQSQFQESNLYSVKSNSTVQLNFCLRTELLLADSSPVSVSFVESKVYLDIDFSAGFEIQNIALERNIANNLEKSTKFDVYACICNNEENECDPEDPILAQNSVLEICVFPTVDGVEVTSIETLALFQDGIEKYNPIENGIYDALTSAIFEQEKGVITGRMISPFFYDEVPSQVTITGEVILGLTSSRRNLEEQNGDLAAKDSLDHATFDMKLNLLPSSNEIQNDTSSSERWDIQVYLLVGIGAGVLTLVVGASLVLVKAKNKEN